MSTRSLEISNITKLALYGRILGDETRIRILWELTEGEKCVRDLAEHLQMTSSAISHQLRKLRLAGIVKNRRDGKQIYYSYKNDRIREQVVHFTTNTV